MELTKLLLGDDPRAGLELLVDTGLAEVVLPELPALRMAADEHGQHKDVYAHTLQVLEQADRSGGAAGWPPDLVLRWAALLHDIGKPATREFGPGGRVSFHHHEVVGARLARKRLKALRYGKPVVDDVAQLVFLHLRFYGYRDGEWTDSAVRRYVVDAGPLLPRLHKLVRSDCTTRNKRKAAALAAAYDDLEARIDAAEASRRSSTPSGPTSMATRSWPSSASSRDHSSARRTSICWRCGWSTARSARRGGGRTSPVVRRSVELSRRRRDDELHVSRPVAAQVPHASQRVTDRDDDHRRGRATVLGQHHGGEHGGDHEREVEQRVVEGEHPAAELVVHASAARSCRRMILMPLRGEDPSSSAPDSTSGRR